MTIIELRQELYSHGVILTVEGGQLKVTAPAGVLTPALWQELTHHKSALLSLLRDLVTLTIEEQFDYLRREGLQVAGPLWWEPDPHRPGLLRAAVDVKPIEQEVDTKESAK